MSELRTILLAEDDADLRASTVQLLTVAGYSVLAHPDGESALAAVRIDFPGVILTDIRMPGMSGIDLFRAVHRIDPELPVILITGHGDVETAVDALKAGAWDFLVKPCDPETLQGAVARGVAARTLVIENRRLRAAAEATGAGDLVGQSAAIRQVRSMIPAVGDLDLDMVVEGATGTGKQLVARLIHRAGRRARHRFVAIDCAAPPSGAGRDLFDGAGLVSRAHRGTLFLDNLDRADPLLQHRLSQFVEHRALALDAREPQPIDARIIAAIDDGGREHVQPALYHRLAGIALRLPPLHERSDDISILIAHFLGRIAETHRRAVPTLRDAAALMARQTWSGNVRELEMAVERLVLGLEDSGPKAVIKTPLNERLHAFERAAIVEAIAQASGDVSSAIQSLGMKRETFYYRIKRLDIDLPSIRASSRVRRLAS
ncbi:sigma-54 dependent transcriptional regulator [Sphingomonas sp. LB3N6]|uniref:sigma-54-dependent transcriptional regulator n=1 Tax=Sphingomonas fucosidasi TaxID=3096164 RepID=UPI002FC92681